MDELHRLYNRARKSPKLRQAYADAVLAAYPNPNVRAIVYDRPAQHLEEFLNHIQRRTRWNISGFQQMCEYLQLEDRLSGKAYACISLSDSLVGKGITPPIFLSKEFFSHQSIDARTALVLLTRHEYKHTDDLANGIPHPNGGRILAKDIAPRPDMKTRRRIRKEIFGHIMEARAHSNEMYALREQGLLDTLYTLFTIYSFQKHIKAIAENVHYENDYEHGAIMDTLALGARTSNDIEYHG